MEYGQSGIDTQYEREKIAYRPVIKLKKSSYFYEIEPKQQLKIERSATFKVSDALEYYDHLLARIDDLMLFIQKSNDESVFKQYLDVLHNKSLDEIVEKENELAGYKGKIDYEVYTILYRIKSALDMQRAFIWNRFGTYFIHENNLDLLKEKEEQALEEWLTLEYKIKTKEKDLYDLYQEHYHDDQITNEKASHFIKSLENEISQLYQAAKEKEIVYTTLADIAYVHLNRATMLDEIVGDLEEMVRHPERLLQGDMKNFILFLSEFNRPQALKAHLILSFKMAKEKHNGLKQQYVLMSTDKERRASEKEWFFQQMETKASYPVLSWLYEHYHQENDAFNDLANLVTEAAEKAHQEYENALVDLLKYYRNEANYYHQQIQLIRKKEKIRKYLRIIEDLEEVEQATDQWIDEYVKMNGYQA